MSSLRHQADQRFGGRQNVIDSLASARRRRLPPPSSPCKVCSARRLWLTRRQPSTTTQRHPQISHNAHFLLSQPLTRLSTPILCGLDVHESHAARRDTLTAQFPDCDRALDARRSDLCGGKRLRLSLLPSRDCQCPLLAQSMHDMFVNGNSTQNSRCA